MIDNALGGGWGTAAQTFDESVREAFVAALSDPDHIHAICEEYRAAASIDRDHDAADRLAGNLITCPMLVLWSGLGPLAEWYVSEGGPLAIWRGLAHDVEGRPVDGGHFFAEEHPTETAKALRDFAAKASAD